MALSGLLLSTHAVNKSIVRLSMANNEILVMKTFGNYQLNLLSNLKHGWTIFSEIIKFISISWR